MVQAPTILVVDDEVGVATLLAELLADEGYRTTTARNGAEALDKVRASAPDLVITDFMMPIRNGLELCYTLQADPRTRTIPIILISAVADQIPPDLIEADAMLAKPLDFDALLACVATLLRRPTPAAG